MKTLALIACMAFTAPAPGELERKCYVISDPVPEPQCLAVVDAFEAARAAGKKPVMYLDGKVRLGPVESLSCEPDNLL